LDLSVRLGKILALVAVTAGMLYGGFLCLLYFSQASIIYPGAKNRVDVRPPQSDGAEVFRISTALGNVEALFLPASPSEAAIRGAMDAAYDRLAADSRVDRSRIFGLANH
jgi:hypothetical protein